MYVQYRWPSCDINKKTRVGLFVFVSLPAIDGVHRTETVELMGVLRERRSARFSALLGFLLSPRNPTKSPYRFATRSTRASGEHWGGRGNTSLELTSHRRRDIAEQRGVESQAVVPVPSDKDGSVTRRNEPNVAPPLSTDDDRWCKEHVCLYVCELRSSASRRRHCVCVTQSVRVGTCRFSRKQQIGISYVPQKKTQECAMASCGLCVVNTFLDREDNRWITATI